MKLTNISIPPPDLSSFTCRPDVTRTGSAGCHSEIESEEGIFNETKNKMENLDSIDIKLLKLLQDNSRLTTKELAQEVGLSISPVYERVKRLESEGYIDRYVALLNPCKLKLGFIAIVAVKLARQTNEGAREFIEKVQDIKEVTECFSVVGNYDFIMKVYAPSVHYYRTFVLDVLGGIPSVGTIQSTFVMSMVKDTTSLPLRQLEGDGDGKC